MRGLYPDRLRKLPDSDGRFKADRRSTASADALPASYFADTIIAAGRLKS